jgi:hypothetical protein
MAGLVLGLVRVRETRREERKVKAGRKEAGSREDCYVGVRRRRRGRWVVTPSGRQGPRVSDRSGSQGILTKEIAGKRKGERRNQCSGILCSSCPTAPAVTAEDLVPNQWAVLSSSRRAWVPQCSSDCRSTSTDPLGCLCKIIQLGLYYYRGPSL